MAYQDKSLIKTRIIRVRVDSHMDPAAQACAEASGLETAAWYRAVIAKYLEEEAGYTLPCERRVHLKVPTPGVTHDLFEQYAKPVDELTIEERRIVARYLEQLGYDVHGRRKRRLADAG